MPKPSKTPLIQQFLSKNIGKTFSTKEMCQEIGVSLPTLINYIKSNSDQFVSAGYGVYTITAATASA
jgi:predicted AAA+ superfamily ATPase